MPKLRKKGLLVIIIALLMGVSGLGWQDFLDMIQRGDLFTASAPTQTPQIEKIAPPKDIPPAAQEKGSGYQYPKIISPTRRTHILYGDATGGGHIYGAGQPCKSEFPKEWDADKIINTLSAIAANDNVNWAQGRNGYYAGEEMVDGVKIRVILGRKKKKIITGYPINQSRNPCPANDR